MEFNDNLPIYLQIKQVLADRIIRGDLHPGDQLPPVRQLALDLTVNVNTVQRALSTMIQDGIIVTQRGRGNFVTEDATVVSRLTAAVVDSAVASLCTQLTTLGLTDSQIIQAVTQHLAGRDDSND